MAAYMSVDESWARITGPLVKMVASAMHGSAMLGFFCTLSSSSTRVTSSILRCCRSLWTLLDLLAGVVLQGVGDGDVAALDLGFHRQSLLLEGGLASPGGDGGRAHGAREGEDTRGRRYYAERVQQRNGSTFHLWCIRRQQSRLA